MLYDKLKEFKHETFYFPSCGRVYKFFYSHFEIEHNNVIKLYFYRSLKNKKIPKILTYKHSYDLEKLMFRHKLFTNKEYAYHTLNKNFLNRHIRRFALDKFPEYMI